MFLRRVLQRLTYRLPEQSPALAARGMLGRSFRDQPIVDLFGPTVATRHPEWVAALGAMGVDAWFVSPGELLATIAEYEARRAFERELTALDGRGGVVDGRAAAVAAA